MKEGGDWRWVVVVVVVVEKDGYGWDGLSMCSKAVLIEDLIAASSGSVRVAERQ